MGTTFGTSSMPSIFDALAMQENLRDNAALTSMNSGITYLQKKKYDQAIKAFKQATAYKPDMVEAYTALGNAYTMQGNKNKAIEAYKLSLEVDKSQDQVYTQLANLYIDQKRKPEAEKVLRDAVKQNNQHTLAYYTLGQLLAQRKEYKDAETQFRQVIKLEPRDGNGYYALGMALNGQERNSEAIPLLKKATTLKKDFVPAIAELGKAYVATGDTFNAQKQLAKLQRFSTATARFAAKELTELMTKPGIAYLAPTKDTLPLSYGNTPLITLDNNDYLNNIFSTAGASGNFSVKMVFNSEMDAKSVTNLTNWSISKASGGTAGIYDNGLYRPTNVGVPAIPNQVAYDPLTREATLVFSLTQNSTTDGTVDPSHLVFKFKGQDYKGRSMDPAADEIDGFTDTPF